MAGMEEVKKKMNGSEENISTRVKVSRLDAQDQLDRVWSTDESKEAHERMEIVSNAFKTIITALGEDVEREGLVKTPARAAKALFFFTKGYEEKISCKQISSPMPHPSFLQLLSEMVCFMRITMRWLL